MGQIRILQKRILTAFVALLLFSGSGQIQSQDAVVTIKAVGDVVPGSNFRNSSLPKDPQKTFFGSVSSLLTGAGLLFGNFESTLTDYPKTRKDTSRKMVYAFRSPPSYAGILKKTGFDVLNVANNHSLDFYNTGYEDTIEFIRNAGMLATGKKGEIAYGTYGGVSFAFIGYSYLGNHNSMHEREEMKTLIARAKKNASIVVISVHAGAEGSKAIHVKNETEMFYGENRGNLVRFAHAAIDYGADIILGHGPHVPRALELYKNKLIVYSLGNFLGYHVFSTSGYKGYSLVLEVTLLQNGDFAHGIIHPVLLDSSGIPHPDSEGKTISLMRKLTLEDFPDTGLKITKDGKIEKTSR